jgi:DNA-binding NtrC family response regulator
MKQNNPVIRILIVDDEHKLVEAFKKKLEKEGMEVFTALNGQEAISIIEQEALDVGLLDIKLPDVDGVELLARFKEVQPDAELIIITGHASADTAVRSIRLGAYDYLTKPCKLSELHRVITNAYYKKQSGEIGVGRTHRT